MIKPSNYIIKFPSNFNVNSTFNMKNFVIYSTQKHIHDDSFETHVSLSLSLHKINILMLL
jgi:hypothetical protein